MMVRSKIKSKIKQLVKTLKIDKIRDNYGYDLSFKLDDWLSKNKITNYHDQTFAQNLLLESVECWYDINTPNNFGRIGGARN